MAKKSANDKAKLDYAKVATQEALQLARNRLEEIKGLKKEIKDGAEKLNNAKIETRSIKSHVTTLQNTLENIKVTEQELNAVIREKDELLAKCRSDITELQNKIQIEQSKRKDTTEKMAMIKKDHMNVLKKTTSLKEEVLTMAHRLEKTEEVEQTRQDLCNKILKLKDSKKTYKREIQRLKHVIKDLSDELDTKKSATVSLTMEIESMMINYENTQRKFQTDYDYRFYEMKEKHDIELSFYQHKITALERELDKVTSEKNDVEATAISQRAQVDTERQKRLIIEKQFKAVKQSFEDQSKKTQEAIDSFSNEG